MTNMEKVMLTALRNITKAVNSGRSDRSIAAIAHEAIRVADIEINREKDMFTLYAEGFGMKASDFGKTFMFRKRTYKITGCSPNSRTYPIMGTRLPDGKTFKFRAEDIAAKMVRA